jgi:DNA repair exonuclease SbcCD nuclease subunit
MLNGRILVSLSLAALLLHQQKAPAQSANSPSLEEEIIDTERMVATTVARNQALREKINRLKAEFGPSDTPLWNKAQAIHDLVLKANADLSTRATKQEVKDVEKVAKNLEEFVSEMNTTVSNSAYIADFEPKFAPFVNGLPSLVNRSSTIQNQLEVIFDKALRRLRSF